MRTIATVFGIGYVPKIPGTLGSLFGLGVAWLLRGSGIHQAAGALAATGLALWSAGPTARAMGEEDPSCIVIDEVAGMLLTLLFLPGTWPVYLAGFLLFRLLDVWKPSYIRKAQRLPGSWGIVLDDLAAGLLAQILLRVSLAIMS